MEVRSDIDSWELHATHIQFIRESKILDVEEKIDRVSINSTQLLMTAIMIESAICYTLICLVSNFGSKYPERQNGKAVDSRLRRDLKKRVQKSSWGQLPELFHLATGLNLNEISTESWEALGLLNQIRNMLAHGEFIKVVCKLREVRPSLQVDSIEIVGRRRITDYLLHQNLIESSLLTPPDNNIFSDKVAEHFLSHSASFLASFVDNVSQCDEGISVSIQPIKEFMANFETSQT